VLLVHGFPLDHRMWLDQIDALASRYRVIAPDLRGFGGSLGTSGTTTMDRFADDLCIVLDQLGALEPVAVCGLSMGGYVALALWQRHAVRVRALALLDTRAAPDSPEAARNRHKLADRVLAGGVGELTDAMLPKLLAPRTLESSPQVVGRVREMIDNCDPEGVAAALRGMAERPDSTSLLSEINVPTLCLVGESDAISTADEMRQMAAAISGARYVVVPNAGHLTTMENPSATNDALLGFLDAA
jgi:pimeloyl-ACP methyl ester carboxylesterase